MEWLPRKSELNLWQHHQCAVAVTMDIFPLLSLNCPILFPEEAAVCPHGKLHNHNHVTFIIVK
jgi:hypothetical protein